MGFGIALVQSSWREDELVRWASAIEDLIQKEGDSIGIPGRQRPKWYGYKERKVPVAL
jgi:amidase